MVIRLSPRKTAAAFEFLDRSAQEHLLKAMGQAEVAAILNDMAPDDRTGLVEESPAEVTKRLLALLSPDKRHLALSLLGYPRGSVGRLIDLAPGIRTHSRVTNWPAWPEPQTSLARTSSD